MDKNKTLTEAANDLIEHAMEQGIPGRMTPFVEALRVAKNERKAESEAARQEIASLKAQLYDQQAMGLCHVCGWKGVIDYPDGPVCVACEHDKALSPQPTAQAALAAKWQVVPRQLTQDMAAREQEDVGGWRRAGALLYRLTGECRPTNFDEIRVTMANGSRDIGQMSAQAERLLVMLTATQPAAQAAPVDAESWLDLLAEARAALWQPANAALCERLDAFIDAAQQGDAA